MKLSDAVKVYAGSSEAAKVMLGSAEAWSSAPPSKSGTFYIAANGDDGRYAFYSGSFSNSGNGESMGNVGGQESNIFLRFSSVSIPQGSTINSAHLHLKGTGDAYTNVDLILLGSNEDNAAAPENSTQCTDTQTTATVNWTITEFPAGFNATPDIKTVIQEIVNREGWSSGNSLLLFIKATSASYNKRVDIYMRNMGASSAATLDVEWTEP